MDRFTNQCKISSYISKEFVSCLFVKLVRVSILFVPDPENFNFPNLTINSSTQYLYPSDSKHLKGLVYVHFSLLFLAFVHPEMADHKILPSTLKHQN